MDDVAEGEGTNRAQYRIASSNQHAIIKPPMKVMVNAVCGGRYGAEEHVSNGQNKAQVKNTLGFLVRPARRMADSPVRFRHRICRPEAPKLAIT